MNLAVMDIITHAVIIYHIPLDKLILIDSHRCVCMPITQSGLLLWVLVCLHAGLLELSNGICTFMCICPFHIQERSAVNLDYSLSAYNNSIIILSYGVTVCNATCITYKTIIYALCNVDFFWCTSPQCTNCLTVTLAQYR